MYRNTSAIGIDIGRLTIDFAIVTYEGRVLETLSIDLPGKQDRKILTVNIEKGISSLRTLASAKGLNPVCIGISAKGFIDHKSGIVLGPDQGISSWTNVPLAKLISVSSGLPVFVGNDANLMTIAEHRFGVARNFLNVVFVALRTGIGGGIIINGKLYRGGNNAGGEFGQMIINCDNGLSDKGIRGSFEHLASAAAVVRRYRELSGLSSRSRKAPGCKEIFEMSYRKEADAVRTIRENAWLVGVGLANLITIFAPEIIVLGGGMSEAADSYLNLVRKSAFSNSLENCRSEVRIERAELGTKGALIGAAYYSISRLAGKAIW